jgi:fumarate hydratase, class I
MPFHYEPIFSYDSTQSHITPTEYEHISGDFVTTDTFRGKEYLIVSAEALSILAHRAFDDISHLLRTAHLKKLALILEDSEASPNDKFVAVELLKNAVIAAHREFPSCQDTGTCIIMGKKGEQVFTGVDDGEWLSKGVYSCFRERNLRYSQLAPLSMYEEKNTGNNLPAQIEIYSNLGSNYEFLFIAKGGGSANKSFLYQKSKALLNPASMEQFFKEAVKSLGTAACPPYHLAFVVGGTSAESTLKTVKLASCGYLDDLPISGNIYGRAYRDLELEQVAEDWARSTGIGAQFGGKYFVHDVRVIRLPRHGASCPVGLGVSCSADRQIKAKINSSGIYIEKLETHPEQFMPPHPDKFGGEAVNINLNQPMREICKTLSKLPIATRIMLNGSLIVARDIAHAKLFEILKSGNNIPDYFKDYPVYYAGPAKTPEGHASGSFGPTTSQRMDPYVPTFQEIGASLIMLGKGNRSPIVTDSCAKYGGFYLGSIGGPAARLGRDCIKKVTVLDFAELGMEAVWKIEVENFPAFIIVDDKGNDFFRPNKDIVNLSV